MSDLDPLTGAVNLLGSAAMYEGSDRQLVVDAIEDAIEMLPESTEDVHDEFPERAEAVSPHMADGIHEIRRWSGEQGTLRGEE